MPSYNYICKNCESITTVIRSIHDAEKVPQCTKCDTEMVKKYGIGAVTFKGSGWGKDA